jgi:tetratricopeptide (TPR) repeat protein
MVEATIEQVMTLAIQHHQAGRLSEAEQLYCQILAREPGHVIAMHHLGVLAYQTGRNDLAVDLLRRVLTLNPNLPEAHSNLGNVLRVKGQLDEAITACRRAIVLRPNYAEAYNNLGLAMKEKGQLNEAIAAYRQAIALKPNFAEAYNNLAIALSDQGQLDQAIAECRQAIKLKPNYAEAHNNLGNALQNKGERGQAIGAYRQAIVHRPNYAKAYNNLGVALTDQGELDQAIAAYRQAIALEPSFAEAHSNLGNALRDQGELDQAIAACRQAINLMPNDAEAHHNLSLLLLVRGDFHRGWEEYEWRRKCTKFIPPMRNFAQQQWDGGSLEGRTILLYTEQGFGDAIQFIRYLPLVAQRGGKIIVECQAALQRLLRTVPERIEIVTCGEPLPAFDLQCPLLSLPRVFGTTFENIPNIVPYLHADSEDAEKWQRRLDDQLPNVKVGKVGLVWAGNPAHKNDRNRSMKLSSLAPLGQVPGIRFFSLQKGEAAAEAKIPPAGMDLVDWIAELQDFADTAALITNLDLVITIDTAVAHLAGAMGKPIWTLLPFIPDWRWLMDRQDSPWYPTMRLFRQSARGDWEGVIKRVAEALTIGIKNRV